MHGLQAKRSVVFYSALILTVDRVLKIYFWQNRSDYQNGFFVATLNPAAAFSLAIPQLVWWPLALLIIFYCLYQVFRQLEQKQNYWPWILIILGASSNMFDRIMYGGVLDYINLGWWPVFNLSDSMIVLAVGWLLIGPLLDHVRSSRKPL